MAPEEPRSTSPSTDAPDGTRWRRNVAVAVFGAGAAYFLLTEHLAHTIRALPWLIALACPLMHLLMHHGHGGRSQTGHGGTEGPR